MSDTINISDELKESFITYALSILTDRALPDVRDGCKPVHRRILFAMDSVAKHGFKKSAAIVGEVLAKYHPHGDKAAYDSMVRMAQTWSLRYPLVLGQGNFGSVDGDPPAAYRYTEARLSKLGLEMLEGLQENAVPMVENYDGNHTEPTILPGAFPNLLCNGSDGIAVGMATKIPPHNLREVIHLLVALLENPGLSETDVLRYVPGPDFPTGGVLVDGEPEKAYTQGRGRFVVRGEIHEEQLGKRPALVITSIPYQVNKAKLLEEIAGIVHVKDKATKRSILEDIKDVRDESDKSGLRCVLELAPDANTEVVRSRLYALTQLETSFAANLVVLIEGRPVQTSLLRMALCWLSHFESVTVRRFRDQLVRAQYRKEIVQGFLTVLSHVDKVIKVIRNSKDDDEALGYLDKLKFTSAQAKAILGMQLRALTGLSQEKLQAESSELSQHIGFCDGIIQDEVQRKVWLRERLVKVAEEYGDDRRTKITYEGANIDRSQLYEDLPFVISLTHGGYLRAVPAEDYRQQGRGGMGSKGVGLKDGDAVEHVIQARTFEYLLFFISTGKVYGLQVLALPETGKTAVGRHLNQILALKMDERVVSVVKAVDFIEGSVLTATARGIVKRTTVADYASSCNARGVRGLSMKYLDDYVIGASLVTSHHEVFLASRKGMVNRFAAVRVRDMGRGAAGIIGMRLKNGDEVMSLVVVADPENEDVLAVTSRGYGKKTNATEYRRTKGGTQGMVGVKVSTKTGPVVSFLAVKEGQDILVLTRNGKAIRVSSMDLSSRRRRGMMVKLVNLEDGDEVSAVTVVLEEEVQEAETA